MAHYFFVTPTWNKNMKIKLFEKKRDVGEKLISKTR